ncbi:recombinase, partial [bacterium]|nr:recombinase [bacterium]
MIEFKTLRWKNLLSTGNAFTEINLNGFKNTLIVGENGAGKSTILDALSFALYGKPFRKITKPQLVNSINQKNTLVEIEFDIGKKQYKVARGIKPNTFEIYCNNELINQSADARDYQEILEKSILKLNHKSFSQVVILGSASFVPFMQLSAAHRREIIEDLLDIQIFSVMNSLLKDDIVLNKSELTEAKYKLESVLDKIEIHNKHIESVKVDTAKLVEEKQEK